MSDRAAIAKIKIAQKELRLDDEAYRAMLQRVTGKRSAAALDAGEQGRVLDELKRLGWTPKVSGRRRRPARPAADHPVARKARALWLSLWNLGAVRDPSEAALEAFGRRQLKVDSLVWADQTQGFRLIEALKAMAEREGWSQQGNPTVLKLKRRLASAQIEVLKRLAPPMIYPVVEDLEEDELDAAITVSGEFIRTLAPAE